MICKCCPREVIQERVDLGFDMCIECAQTNVKPIKGYMSWEHKTAPKIQLVSSDGFKEYRRYAPHGKNTGMGSGCHRMMSNSERF